MFQKTMKWCSIIEITIYFFRRVDDAYKLNRQFRPRDNLLRSCTLSENVN